MSNSVEHHGPVVLVVLDGWGYRPEREGNAIALASAPNWQQLWGRYPRTLLEASGLRVGLPEGQMGNSEVGHLNLGAGRVVPQDLVRISQSIQRGEFYHLPALQELGTWLRQTGGTLHLVGLLGPGGVHALDRHLLACVELGQRLKVPQIAIHGFLDGRDSAPTLGAEVVRTLLLDMRRIAGSRVDIATLVGRYYAMDRDRRWERTRAAWEAIMHGTGVAVEHPVLAVQAAYQRGETDEFVRPMVHHRNGRPIATLKDGDGIFFFNYRSDRMRQIVAALAVPGFNGFPVGHRPAVRAVTMTQYDQTFPLPQAFPPFTLARILAEVLAGHGKTQLRTAETEKYPHVTYFFNGGYEPPYQGEERRLVASPRVATYDLMPEMSAAGVTDALVGALAARQHDFLLCNFANADMVGHTGVLPAVIKAVETVDTCLGRIMTAAERAGAAVLVTADHGNSEQMIDPATGGPHTAHTTNPVPFIACTGRDAPLRHGGALCDVAPTVLGLLGIEPPADMTGRDLRLPE
jgi:2,3-bisphosphoglycerate-independent phosphoglycerate mutase